MRGHHGDGRNADRIDTSGFVGWSLVHRASRAGDPHHHVHLNIANMVHGSDGKWSAVAAGGRDLMRHTHAAGAFMEARARHLLNEKFGVEVARSERTGQWEIVGIPDSTLRLFSKRDNEIRAFLDQLGLAWDDAGTGARRLARDVTREAKDPASQGTSDSELRARWQREGRAHGDDPSRIAAEALGQAPQPATPDLDRIGAQMFDPNTGITAHRKSFDRAEAFAVVLEQLEAGVSDLAAADVAVDAVLERSPQVIALPTKGPRHMSDTARFTTVDLVEAEQQILTTARHGIGAGAAAVPPETAALSLSVYEAGRGHQLSEEQRVAYERLVTGGHGIDALIGVAGSGKTTILEAARIAWNSAGYSVTGASTAAVAAQNLQAQTGIPSSTIAALLHGNAVLGDVLVIDEAAMVDERSMARIVEMAATSGTKVVGVGDPKQLRAAGVGGSFAHVHEIVAGPVLSNNRRQRDPAEQACAALVREGQFASALHDWAGRDSVHVPGSREEALAAMVLAWADARSSYPDPHARLREVLMVAYTNADVDLLNTGARELLRDRGEIGSAERTWRLPDGEALRLAVGDVVRIRQNLWSTGDAPLLNGNRGIVREIGRDGSIVVDWQPAPDSPIRGRSVSAADIVRGAVSLGYAITDHAAQGQSADVALVYPVGMDANALYPAVTRHRDDLHVFIPLEVVEDDLTRRRLGPPRTEQERIVRGVEALARGIRVVTPEMVSLELAALTGPTHSTQPVPPVSTAENPSDPGRLREVVERALAFYAGQQAPRWALDYLAEHGLRPADLPGHGYAPAGWTALVDHLRADGISDEEMLAAGVARRSSRGTLIDAMRDRLVIPILDETGPVALIGRTAPGTDAPKWLNTPQTDLYRKGDLLHGLSQATAALAAGATPVLVEGPLDVAAINAAGDGRFVGLAPLGTALTKRQVEALSTKTRFEQRDVIVAFDGDDAGNTAAARAYELLAPATAKLLRLEQPSGSDPADILRAEGALGLRRRLESPSLLVEHIIDTKIDRWADVLRWPEGRIGALRDVAPLVAALPPDQAVAQLGRLMHRLDLSHEIVVEAVVAAVPQAIANKESGPARESGRAAVSRRAAAHRRTGPGLEVRRDGTGIGR
jgi:DNA primase catalytic core